MRRRRGRHGCRGACASAGDPLGLERDRGAAHGRNAVAARAAGGAIGRVERDAAQHLAPETDCGARIGASAGSVSRGRAGEASIGMRLRRLGGGGWDVGGGGGSPAAPPG